MNGIVRSSRTNWNACCRRNRSNASNPDCAVTTSARSMLERSMLRYCSEPSQPSHKLPISALVPEMICNRLFNSLVAFETDSFETDLRRCGDEPSEFTIAPCSIRDALFHGKL